MEETDKTSVDSDGNLFMKSVAESMGDLTIHKYNSLTNYKDEDSCQTMCLQKAHSVPQLTSTASGISRQGSITRRKKTSEASPIPESLLHSNLLQENQNLKQIITKLEEEKQNLLRVNNLWDTDYNALKHNVFVMEKEMAALKEENNEKAKEIAKHEKHVKRLTKKLELMFVANSADDEPLWKQVDPDDMTANPMPADSFNDEEEFPMDGFLQPPLQQPQLSGLDGGYQRKPNDFSPENQELKHQINLLNTYIYDLQEQSKVLEKHLQQKDLEMQRMALDLQNPLKKCDKHLSTTSLSPSNIEAYGDQAEVEILRHQLKVYVEDFRMETEERKKLHNENLSLKKKLSQTSEDQEHLKNQLKTYEEDFYRERNKRIQLMKQQQENHSQNTFQQQRKWQEYQQLMDEKERIDSRLKEMSGHHNSSTTGSGNGGGVSVDGLPGRSSSVSSDYRAKRTHAPLQQQYSGPSSVQFPHNSSISPSPFAPSPYADTSPAYHHQQHLQQSNKHQQQQQQQQQHRFSSSSPSPSSAFLPPQHQPQQHTSTSTTNPFTSTNPFSNSNNSNSIYNSYNNYQHHQQQRPQQHQQQQQTNASSSPYPRMSKTPPTPNRSMSPLTVNDNDRYPPRLGNNNNHNHNNTNNSHNSVESSSSLFHSNNTSHDPTNDQAMRPPNSSWRPL